MKKSEMLAFRVTVETKRLLDDVTNRTPFNQAVVIRRALEIGLKEIAADPLAALWPSMAHQERNRLALQ